MNSGEHELDDLRKLVPVSRAVVRKDLVHKLKVGFRSCMCSTAWQILFDNRSNEVNNGLS